ncbi:MAG TPA: choice-of-anchor J domain-containing protein [Tenuifilaceae bacterium]|nr:choice-of-anchor J domain-containing protein [Tenuifilaceae bacterium]
MKRFVIAFLFLLITFHFNANSQLINDLSFGTDNSLEVVTWNLELFPVNGQTTVENLSQALQQIEADVIAFQEIDNETLFSEMVNGVNGFEVAIGTSGGDWKLAYIYRSETVEVNSVYEIYTSSEYSAPFPRRPLVFDFNFEGDNYIVINNHYKCCGDGVIDQNDEWDEETRRYNASNLIKEYIDNNFPNKKVFVVGDLNDVVTDEEQNNVFQMFIDDTENYLIADMPIATGDNNNWSFPSWPSHIDHIIITNELFDAYNSESTVIQTIKVDSYLSGGLSEYYENFSDHRPVGLKLSLNSTTIFNKNFEDQELTSGGWAAFSVTGEEAWRVPADQYGHNNTYCGYMNGYNSGAKENEDWFISPTINADSYSSLTLSFWNTSGYSGPALQAYISNNFSDNPTTASWDEITGISWHNGATSWEWTYSGEIDLSSVTGDFNIAFKYTSTTSEAAAWEIDDITLSGQVGSYTINATANPANGGTINGAGTYEYGETVELAASPAENFNFVSWTENQTVVSTQATYTFEATENRNLTANFEIQSYTISATVNPSNSGSVLGTGTYNHGETVTLTATANTGYSFVNWTENGNQVSTNPTYSFPATKDRNLVANFQIKSYIIDIEINPEDGGTVTGAGTYEHGETVNLTATESTGYTFSTWTENSNEVSSSKTYSFTAESDRNLTANFLINTYIVSTSVQPQNSGTVSGGGEYNYNSTATLEATPNAGWLFEKWSINGSESTQNPYSFAVTEATEAVAYFVETEEEFTLTIAKNGNGSTTPDVGTYTYTSGETINLTATPDNGWQFEKWLIGENEITESSTSITLTRDTTATAVFVVVSSIDSNTENSLVVFPNPSSRLLYIKCEEHINSIKLYSVTGKLILETTASETLDVGYLPSGMYTLKIELADGVETRQFLKQ